YGFSGGLGGGGQPVDGGGPVLFVFQGDGSGVAEAVGAVDPLVQRQLAGARCSAALGVGDLDVTEVRGLGLDDRGDVVGVDRHVEQVGEHRDVLGSGGADPGDDRGGVGVAL